MKKPKLEDFKREVYDGDDYADWYKEYYQALEKYAEYLEGKAFHAREVKAFPHIEEMDLRDYFAIHASREDIESYIEEITDELNEETNYNDYVNKKSNPEIVCYARYRYADDMMEARDHEN